MTYPHIETQADYERYQRAFEAGTEGFAIVCGARQYRHIFRCNHEDCEGCETELVTFDPSPDEKPDCEGWCDGQADELISRDEEGETSAGFSYQPCDICDRALGGDRYHFVLTNPDKSEPIYCEACTDCLYYAEYGQLDDMTMQELEG